MVAIFARFFIKKEINLAWETTLHAIMDRNRQILHKNGENRICRLIIERVSPKDIQFSSMDKA